MTITTNTKPVAPKAVPDLPADLDSGSRRLKLAGVRRTAAEVLAVAKTQRWTPEEVLRILVEAAIAARDAGVRTFPGHQWGLQHGHGQVHADPVTAWFRCITTVVSELITGVLLSWIPEQAEFPAPRTMRRTVRVVLLILSTATTADHRVATPAASVAPTGRWPAAAW